MSQSQTFPELCVANGTFILSTKVKGKFIVKEMGIIILGLQFENYFPWKKWPLNKEL